MTGGLERREDLPVNEFSSALRGNLIDSCKCANISIRRRRGIRRTRVPESYRMMMVLDDEGGGERAFFSGTEPTGKTNNGNFVGLTFQSTRKFFLKDIFLPFYERQEAERDGEHLVQQQQHNPAIDKGSSIEHISCCVVVRHKSRICDVSVESRLCIYVYVLRPVRCRRFGCSCCSERACTDLVFLHSDTYFIYREETRWGPFVWRGGMEWQGRERRIEERW